MGEGKDARYRVSYASEDFVEAIPLVEQLKGWRKRAVYVDGEQLPWDAVFGFLWCYNRRLGSYEPERYCFGAEGEWQANLWGCIQAEMPFRAGAAWLTWGRWLTEDGDWQFDRERILHGLRRQLHRYRFWPLLEMPFVENVVSALPTVVKPKRDRGWTFVRGWAGGPERGLALRYRESNTVIRVNAVGVAPSGPVRSRIARRLKRCIAGP